MKKQMNNSIELAKQQGLKNDAEESYGDGFIARFACLYEGVNLAAAHAERVGVNTDKSTSWIKPGALQKYVEERFGDMKYNINRYRSGVDDDEIYPWSKI
jgi:hypothetical protein